MRHTRVAAIAGATLTGAMLASGVLTAAPASADPAELRWTDGVSASDRVWECLPAGFADGVAADVGWATTTGQPPAVGESFYLRGRITLLGDPCQLGYVETVPELLVPPGLEFAGGGELLWDLTRAGEEQELTAEPIGIAGGVNGGEVLVTAEGEPFRLYQGDLLEFQVPVVATRPLNGAATDAPTCTSRVDGDAPCRRDRSGDHVQIAFTLGPEAYQNDRQYVIPYLSLLTQPGDDGSGPGLPGPGPGGPLPGGPGVQQGQVASSTTASYRTSAKRPGTATVTVTASRTPTGEVVVRDLSKRGRVVARASLESGDEGRLKLRLRKLSPGKHRLVAEYAGSATVAASTSAVRAVRAH